jgi:hypothetical protein
VTAIVSSRRALGGVEFVVSCETCQIEPMGGLTYDGAVTLRDTHNQRHVHRCACRQRGILPCEVRVADAGVLCSDCRRMCRQPAVAVAP